MKAAIIALTVVGVLGASVPILHGPRRVTTTGEVSDPADAGAKGTPSTASPQASRVPPLNTLEDRLKASEALKRGELDEVLDELEVELARVRMLINGGK